MKKVFFAVFFTSLSVALFSQNSKQLSKNKVTSKDTLRKGKGETVPISKMSNTLNTNSNLNGTDQNVTVPNNTNDNKSATLDELIKRINRLEASLDALNNRLPFENMAFVTVVANETNLEGATAAYPDRFKSIKIDHPLCNRNPKAKIFATREIKDRFNIGHIDYSPIDGYWHLFPATVCNLQISPLEIVYQKNGYGQDITLIKDYDNFEDFVKQGSFLWAYPTILKKGDAFQLLIFTDLPDYNPAIYQRPVN